MMVPVATVLSAALSALTRLVEERRQVDAYQSARQSERLPGCVWLS